MNSREQTLDQFQQWLGNAADEFQYPQTPVIASHVVERLRVEPVLQSSRISGFMRLERRGRLLRISAAALALVVLAFTLTVATSPSVRAAVLEVLRLKRVEVIRVDELPRVLDEPAEIEQLAGRTSLVGLETRAGFLVRTATYPEGLGPPDEVYFQDLGSGRQVVLVYRARPGLSLQPVDAGDVLFTLFQFSAEGFFRKIIP